MDDTPGGPVVRHHHKHISDDNRWIVRRAIIMVTWLFCGWVIGYLTLYGVDNVLSRELVHDSFMLAGAVILLYAFGRLLEPAIVAWAMSKGKCDGNP